MRVEVHKSPGLRNDILIIIPRSEVDDVLFQIANRDSLRMLPGLLRHVPRQDEEQKRLVGACKITLEEHMSLLQQKGTKLADSAGKTVRPLLVIGSRNVGNNHGFIAWQRDRTPRFFHIEGDPLNYPAYSCLCKNPERQLSIKQLQFRDDRVLEAARDITEEIEWSVYAYWVLRRGAVMDVAGIAEQFYDVRHLLAFDRSHPDGQQIESAIFEGYPDRFRENILRAWYELGIPRNRYLHNCIGLSDESIFILQREGTIEEMANWLKEAGATDGMILDNGASVFSWAWWPYPKGGYLFTAPDFRPRASAVLAFVLKGPASIELPGGSVSFTTL